MMTGWINIWDWKGIWEKGNKKNMKGKKGKKKVDEE
jgi:hypothetical protein